MRRSFFFITTTIAVVWFLGIGPACLADSPADGPLWNLAWITDTQTPECEWITVLTARVAANRPRMLIHTGDTRFEWANRCAWRDVVNMLRIETPPIEFHLAPGNHDLTNGVLKLHLRRAASQGAYLLDTGLTAPGRGYYHNRVTKETSGPLWPVWNPEVAAHPAWQTTANKRPLNWQDPDLPYHYVFKRGGIRFIVCDTFYTERQREWLRQLLSRPDDSAVSIVLQHKHEVDDLAKYFDGLEGRHNVKLVLSGDHHQYCHEQRDGITYITSSGVSHGHHGDCDAMTLWVYEDRLRLDRYVIAKGLPMSPIRGPETIWSCPGKFEPYQRPEFPASPLESIDCSGLPTTKATNLIKNGNFENGIWYERFRGWSPSHWYQWFKRGGHVPEHAVGKRLPHSGKEYVRLHMWAYAWTAGILQNVRGVQPCHMYRMTAYGFFQPEGAPAPGARIGIDPTGALAGQFSVDVSKHPAPRYDEGVGDDPKTEKLDGPDFPEDTVWSNYRDFYGWGRFEVEAEAASDVITAILCCSPEQRPADRPIYEMNWDSVKLREIPWPSSRLIAQEAVLTPSAAFKKIVVNVRPEPGAVQVTWKTDLPAGASQLLYDFRAINAPQTGASDRQVRGRDFTFETPVQYEESANFHWITIEHPRIESAYELELVMLSRMLVDGRPVTLCSPVRRFRLAKTLPIESARKAENWRDNIVAGGSMSHESDSAGGMLFDMQFADSDPWCYPLLELKEDEIPDASFRGLELTVELIEGDGIIRVQFLEEGNPQYVAETHYDARKKSPQRVRAMFNQGIWRPTSPRDANGRLDPGRIRKIMVGINSRRNTRVKMAVRDLQWVK